MAEFKQLTIPVTLHTRSDSELMAALERARIQGEKEIDHDLKYGFGVEHAAEGCGICTARRYAAKYCHECGRPYEDEKEEENG